MSKKIFALMLVTVMLFSLAACGEKKSKNQGDGSITDGYLFKNKDSVELGEPDVKLDPAEVYSKLSYTPEMFYGDYRLRGGDEAEEKFGEESAYRTRTEDGKEAEYTKLPFRITAGSGNLQHSVSNVKGYNWMRVYYMRRYDDGKAHLTTKLCAYSIEENKLILKPLSQFEADKENNKITYAFSDEVLEYTFSFQGRSLTLSAEDSSVTLTNGLDAYGKKDYFYVDNYLSPDSESIDGVDSIEFYYNADSDTPRVYFDMVNDEKSYNSIAVLQENGLFTFTLALEESVKTYQFVYFYGFRNGIVLTDGNKVYYYNDTSMDRNKIILNEYVTEDQTGKLETLTEAQLEAIAKKKENLMQDLAKAFDGAGIKVTVDEKSGELAMDSSVLFGGDSDVLTAEGKTFLNKFVDAYTSIVFSEKYENFITKTMIEGHTAPLSGSTYESGLPLSEKRANNVKAYCISSETGVDTEKLAKNLEAVGYSNSKPITDAKGEVDMEASRRVSFRFIINLEQVG